MTDTTGGPPEDDPNAPAGSPPEGELDVPAASPPVGVPDDDADLGWRALAGSLDDLGFAPLPAAETERSDRAHPAATDPAATDPTATLSGHPRPRQYSRGATA
ncbi:MAG: hypothetical protein OXI97_17495, partial [Acidimicrobiaceae bacterium]|nr:hypothetical protein [Acidimicrobiaceae bacterium]